MRCARCCTSREFQNAESLWRGMDLLLRRIETGPMLQVLLLDMSAEEFAADLSGVSDLSETGLYQLLVEKPSQEKAGGVSLICGPYQFEPTPPHAELLGRMAKIAAQANAPFLTTINVDTLMTARRSASARRAGARSLKALPEASHLGLLGAALPAAPSVRQAQRSHQRVRLRGVHAEDGLRGMLWGHPALLARACLLAGPKAPGSRSATCRSTTTSTPTATRSRCRAPSASSRTRAPDDCDAGASSGLMANKGQPELRVAGLETVGAMTARVAGHGASPVRA